MHPVAAQRFGKIVQPTEALKPPIQIGILRDQERAIATGRVKALGPHHQHRLKQVGLGRRDAERIGARGIAKPRQRAEPAPIRVDLPCRARHRSTVGVRLEIADLPLEPVRVRQVVGIVPGDKGRGAGRKPRIERRDDPAIGLRDDVDARILPRGLCEQFR
jgi:hypothetical protein